MDDVQTLTDEELEQIRVEIRVETDRRATLAAIPRQIKTLIKQYEIAGGDPADLTREMTDHE